MKILYCVLFLFTMSTIAATVINIPEDYLNIRSGIEAAEITDTVLVQPGIYIENIDFQGKNITVGCLCIYITRYHFHLTNDHRW